MKCKKLGISLIVMVGLIVPTFIFAYINPDILQENWDDLIGWSDDDSGGCVSEINPAGQLYLTCIGSTGGYARRQKVIEVGTGDYYIEEKIKLDSSINGEGSRIEINAGLQKVFVRIGNGMSQGNGITMYDGTTYNLAYGNTWDTNFHTIVFYVHNIQTDCDIWVDKDPATESPDVIDADCSAPTDTITTIATWGQDSEEYHIDYLYIGTTSSIPEPVCGNDIIENGEICDGTDLGGETCVSQGFQSGVLGCAVGCLSFDTSQCSYIPVGANIIPMGIDFPSNTMAYVGELFIDLFPYLGILIGLPLAFWIIKNVIQTARKKKKGQKFN